MNLIAISGTNGSGKDTVGQLLADKYSWMFVSVSELLRDEARKRGLSPERENTRIISAEWRRQFGLGVLMEKAVEQYKASGKKFNGLVIANARNPGEVDYIHKMGGKVMWLDADPKVRYKRVETRARGPEDHKTFEQFMADEEAEMHPSGDDATLNMAGVKAKADIFIENNSSDIETFKAAIEQALAQHKLSLF